jgi:DNA-binding NtrC family response regulator
MTGNIASLKVLIVEDYADLRTEIFKTLSPYHEVYQAEDLKTSRELLSKTFFDIVILDKFLPDGEAISLIPEIKNKNFNSVIIILTGDQDRSQIKKYLDIGVDDYVSKSEICTSDLLLKIPLVVGKAASIRKSETLTKYLRSYFEYDLIGSSQPMNELRSNIMKLKNSDSNVLITGETGTGKELVAHLLHNLEDKNRPFVAVNCGAIPLELVESELFGSVKGSFTGAYKDQIGKFELANHGDIFLDEVADLPLSVQVKLLRILNSGEYSRVGEAFSRKCEFRVIAATNKNLEELIQQGKFREDLYYRLAIITLKTPSLREREEDVPQLAKFLINRISNGHFSIHNEALELLKSYPWPGNVRELKNCIERAWIYARNRHMDSLTSPGELITNDFSFLTKGTFLKNTQITDAFNFAQMDISKESLEKYLISVETAFYKNALNKFDNDVEALANHLGYGRSTLFKKLNYLGLSGRQLKNNKLESELSL